MEIVKHLFWTYPAVIMTVWTLLTFMAARTLPLGGPISVIFGFHGMLLQYNPMKDHNIYQRPSFKDAAFFLVAGLIPVVCALLLLAHILVMSVGTFYAVMDKIANRRVKA